MILNRLKRPQSRAAEKSNQHATRGARFAERCRRHHSQAEGGPQRGTAAAGASRPNRASRFERRVYLGHGGGRPAAERGLRDYRRCRQHYYRLGRRRMTLPMTTRSPGQRTSPATARSSPAHITHRRHGGDNSIQRALAASLLSRRSRKARREKERTFIIKFNLKPNESRMKNNHLNLQDRTGRAFWPPAR